VPHDVEGVQRALPRGPGSLRAPGVDGDLQHGRRADLVHQALGHLASQRVAEVIGTHGFELGLTADQLGERGQGLASAGVGQIVDQAVERRSAPVLIEHLPAQQRADECAEEPVLDRVALGSALGEPVDELVDIFPCHLEDAVGPVLWLTAEGPDGVPHVLWARHVEVDQKAQELSDEAGHAVTTWRGDERERIARQRDERVGLEVVLEVDDGVPGDLTHEGALSDEHVDGAVEPTGLGQRLEGGHPTTAQMVSCTLFCDVDDRLARLLWEVGEECIERPDGGWVRIRRPGLS